MWSDPSTWEDGAVPTDGSDVSIPQGITVTVASQIETRVKYLNVGGTLRHATDTNSKLRVETIEAEPDSRYEIGTSSTPVQQDVTAEVEIIDEGPIDESEWPHRKNKGFMLKGDVEIVGAEKTPWTTLADPATAGDTSIELTSEPTNWNAGDEIVIPGMTPYSSASLDHEDDRRTVKSVSGTTVTLESALDHDHVPPKDTFDSYVMNLTRNVHFYSENTDEHRRGHLMIMSTASDVRYVQFTEMGRTNKDEPITNPVRNADQVDADDPNPAARYPFHYHRTGIEADPHYAEGLAVDGSPGWGVVNHHAHADIVDSVTYDVFGSGFVAEGGNERGSFKRNLAVRSTGSGDTIDTRAAGAHGGDLPIDDFGHAGHGFWLQSPLVEVVDNVAAGHRHQAFVWWLRPLLDKPEETLAEDSCAGGDIEDSRVAFCPNLPMRYVPDDWPILDAIEYQRFSTDEMDQLMWDTQKINSTFAPLATVSGNTAFGAAGGADFSRHNFKWKHERFSDFNVIEDFTVYNIGTFYDEDGDAHEPKLPRHRAAGNQGRGGSVGISFRYTSNVSLVDSHLVGTGQENSVGVPFHDYLWTSTVDNCTVENWDYGVDSGEHRLTWVRNNTFRDNTYDVNWGFDNAAPAVLEGNDLNLVRHDINANLKSSEAMTFSRGRGLRVNGRTSYADESAPDYVPFPTEDDLGFVNNWDQVIDDETQLVGLTNAEMYEQFGLTLAGGKPMPDDAVSEPFMDESKLDPVEPRSPPLDVTLDATTADTLGAWEVVSEPDTANGKCLRWTGSSSPKDTPASMTFDCAAGTYEVKLRFLPNAWNGDIVYVRIDGGEWKPAEKLKSPIGFAWHDAAPNNEPGYEWELSEGTHTIEVACDNDDAKLDEVFIGSGAEVLGAYGMSATSGTSSEDACSVTTDTATNVVDTSATLNGSLDNLGGADSADVYFEYRQAGASSWTSTATQTLSTTDSFNVDVTALEDGVDYEFRAVAEASDGDTSTGNNVKFTTTDDPPAVTTDASSSVGETSATLNGSLDDLGDAASSDVYFEYRQTGASSWNMTPTQTLSSTGTVSESVSGLDDGVGYEYRTVADASDGDTATGSSVTFTTTDNAPAVTTDGASNVGSSSATLNGSLDGLGGANSADVYFEYRQAGASSWTSTATQTLSTTGSFNADITNIASGTDYEYRAVAEGSDSDTDFGTTVSFTTSSSNSAPSIDSYTVTEAGSPNPHCEITADWSVSDADGNLDTVEVEVVNGFGMIVDSATTAANGSAASGTDQFRIKHANDKTFDVTLTVTDSSGSSSSGTKTVTE